MGDNIRVVQVQGQAIELVHGSDLYWLWAWADQIQYYFYEDPEPPSPGEWLGPFVFFPTDQAKDAMGRLGIKYREMVDQMRDSLKEAEEKLDAFCTDQNDDTRDDLFFAMEELQHRIGAAVLVIAENEAPAKNTEPTDTKEEKSQKGSRKWTVKSAGRAIVKHISKNEKLTLDDLAKLTGIPRSTISESNEWKRYASLKRANSKYRKTPLSLSGSEQNPDEEEKHDLENLIDEQLRDSRLDDCRIPQKRL